MKDPIFFRTWGPEQAPTLVLIHGDWADGSMAWTAQVDALSPHYQLIVLDRRGHGKSPLEPRPYTIEGDADDVAAIIEGLGLDRFHLVGHSYGGLVALEVACRLPAQVNTLHLVEPAYLALLPTDPDVQQLRRGAQTIRKRSDWDSETIAINFFTLLVGRDFAEQLQEKSAWPYLVSQARRFVDGQFAGEYPPAKLNQLDPDIPCQVYSGGRSHPALAKIAGRVAKELTGANLVQIDSAYHDVQRSGQPFNTALRRLVDRHP